MVPVERVSLLDVEAAVGRELDNDEIMVVGRMVELGADLAEVVNMVESGLHGIDVPDEALPVRKYEPQGDGAQEVP